VGSKWMAVGVVVILCASLGTACHKRTRLEILALAVKDATEDFKEEKQETSKTLESVEQARQAAASIHFKFKNKETQAFIEKWRLAENRVRRLREEFNKVIKAADFLFAYCEKKMKSIGDQGIRLRAAKKKKKRKAHFSDEGIQTNNALMQLEAKIKRGNDFISGLEIAGALNTLDEQEDALHLIEGQGKESLPEIDGLIKQGEILLNSEFTALGV